MITRFEGPASLLVLTLGFAILAACEAAPQEVSLAQLARQQNAYDGRVVVTAGVLRSHSTPRHYWIADAADHRVELLSDEDLSPHIGRMLAVQGRFRYAADRGRRVEVTRYAVDQELTPSDQR